MKPWQREPLDKSQVKDLLSWFKKNQRDFPWRRDPAPYRVWLAEIMSQQTTMTALLPYFHRFIERFPNVQVLARAPEEDVLSAWAGLGYYSRARNLHRAAKMIAGELGGRFPQTVEGLLSLPGVGPYTAAAIASQCFGVEEPVWDGNVVRVCSRLYARADAFSSTFRADMEGHLRESMKGYDVSAFNQAFMELGATVCTPKSPACGKCPLHDSCEARKQGHVALFPPPKPRKQNIELKCRVHVRLARDEKGACLVYVQRRPETHWFAGLWDFPSELGGIAQPVVPLRFSKTTLTLFGQARHQITHHRIFLEGCIEIVPRAQRLARAKESGWFPLDELISENPPIPLSTTAKKVLKTLLRSQAQGQLSLF